MGLRRGARRGNLSILLLFMLSLLVACTEKQKGAPIEIPPGQLIEYTNNSFLPFSEAFYNVELQKLATGSDSFFTIQDLTPAQGKESIQTIHFIVPKDKNEQGIFILKVSLPRHGVSFSSFVLPNRMGNPGPVSTLAVEFLKNYPGKPVNEVTESEVLAVEAAIEKAMIRTKAEFEMTELDLPVKKWMRFLQNSVARDPEFLASVDQLGFEFDVNGQGWVDDAPYPFGVKNTPPSLDIGNSTAVNRAVTGRETEETTIKARIVDPEGDDVVYRWFLEGAPASKEPTEYKWSPTFDQSRALPYKIKASISDGGIPLAVEWDVQVLDKNRPPELDSHCELKVREWDTWSCTLKAKDYDGDPLRFSVSDKGTNARVSVDGQPTDNVTRKLEISGKDEILIEITPNNFDAKKRVAYVEVNIDDGKLGNLFVPMNIIVEDINSAPIVVLSAGSMIQPFVPGDQAREWDYCSNEDPDGGQPFRFMVQVQDPDNLPSAGVRSMHPDNVSVNFGGSLKDALVILGTADGCPAATATDQYFCFEWKPKSVPRTGTITLTMKDDHGGVLQIPSEDYPLPITLTSMDRNVRPCLNSSNRIVTMTENILQSADFFDAEDPDETSPWLELSDVPLPVMPLLTTQGSGNPSLVFRKTFFNPNNWLTRFAKASSGPTQANYSVWLRRPVAGVVVFQRSAPHTSSITISQGTLLKTSGTLPRVQYEVAQTVVMDAEDKEVVIPVKAYNRTVAIGKLNRFIVAPSFSVTVQNLSALTGTGTVRLTRASSAVENTLAAGTEIGTSEIADGTDTVRYETVDNVKMGVGVLTMDIRVRRKIQSIDAGTVTLITSASWPGPALSVSNPLPLSDQSDYTLARDLQLGVTMGVDRFCWNRRATDSGVLPTGTLLTVQSGTIPAGVSVSTSGSLGLEGWVLVQRSVTTGTATIASGTAVRSADASRFTFVDGATLAPGVASALARVLRVNHMNASLGAAEQMCAGWSDTNFEPVFLSGSNGKVTEGQSLLDFEINVTDNLADPTSPKDPLDRFSFTSALVGSPPSGSYVFCRHPGDNPANINSPACVPCTDTTGTVIQTASCYLRYKPALNDVSQSYSFNVTANDNGLNFPMGTNLRSQSLNIFVIEINDPPVFTDSVWAPISNQTLATNYYLGKYIEGVESKYPFYITDPDKGVDLKNQIAPKLLKTWQFISPSGWTLVTNPKNFYIELVGSTQFNGGGWGSKATAQFRWTPLDEDAKRLAGPAGFVAEVEACDVGNTDSPRQCTTGFFRMDVDNVNNLPTTTLTALTVQADLYQATNFTVTDRDYFANPVANGGFQTRLSMCSTPGVYSCDADQTGWPVALGTHSDPYPNNATVALCQTGGVLTSLKTPQFLLNAPVNGTVSGTTSRNYSYAFRWCPQRSHIGKHLVFFNLTDNGDEDYRGASSTLTRQLVQIPIQLRVVAPVFFESPRRGNGTNEAVSWMKQAFSLTPFSYELIINNSRGNLLTVTMPKRALVGTSPIKTVGNPMLEVRRFATPTVVNRTHATTITGLNTAIETVYLVWKPYGTTATTPYVSDPLTATTWPQFEFNVKDQTTAENETVNFRVLVKDPLSPSNSAPTIDSVWPPMASMSIPEQIAQAFAVTASDPNSDYLHYRWYVDDILVSDGGANYSYLPTMDDAFMPLATPGLHTVRVEVTDGVERTAGQKVIYTWNVKVRNTVPLPQRLTYANAALTPWTMMQSIGTRYSGAITNLTWGPTVGVATKSGATTNNHLLFAGTYTRAAQVRNFIWRLQFTNAAFTANVPTTAAQGNEFLPWAGGRKSEQISYIQDAANLTSVLVTSVKEPDGVFASTSDAVKLNPILSTHPALTAGNACTGVCAQNFFRSTASPSSANPARDTMISGGTLPSASFEDSVTGVVYQFFSANEGATIKWNRAGNASVALVNLPGNDRVGDIAVNQSAKRLYFSTRDPSLQRNFITTYDISNISSGTVSYVTSFAISDGVNPDNRIMDLVVDSVKNRVYALLPGTGGVAYFNDDGLSVPQGSSVQFIGVSQISSSLTDQVGGGRKLVFNPGTQLLYGISSDANEIFVIDTMSDAFGVRVFRSDLPLDEVITFTNDGLTLGINRLSGLVYLIR